MTLTYRRFTAVLLLIYDSVYLSGVYYCLSVFRYAVARMSDLVREFLASKQITVLEHEPYSPDLAPNDILSSRR
jgi:hypothetical protein